jgi:diaminobutyrate-2-oxoglutarate transaminase
VNLTIPIDLHDLRESRVRTYCRSFPEVFERAKEACLYGRDGRRYIDFFGGAGAMNYGHNNPRLNRALIEYLEADGVVHALDMATSAKLRFLECFQSTILEPRGLDYKMQFTGPAGTNAMESALKIARLNKGRATIAAFTNAYHGLTIGALAITGNEHYRNEAFVNRADAVFLPYDGYLGPDVDTLGYIRKLLDDPSSGVDLPAAIAVECVQAEGGINVARDAWLRGLEILCRELDILLIVDDIQVGCGRTGSFFSFERAGIKPDIVALSKSISGSGLPMSVVLMKPELDQWKRGEETATFRGFNLSFITAAEALSYWKTGDFAAEIRRRGEIIARRLAEMTARHPEIRAEARGVGMIRGLDVRDTRLAQAVSRHAFTRGLVMELCGPRDNVLKLIPPLVIPDELLEEGLSIMAAALQSAIEDREIFHA